MSGPEGELFCVLFECIANPLPRGLTQHLDYGLVIDKLSKHFGRVAEVHASLPIQASPTEFPFIEQCGEDGIEVLHVPGPGTSPSDQSLQGIPG